MKYKFSEAVIMNPKEKIKKGSILKKISMQDIQENARNIKNYNEESFSGGSKFRNKDTLFARITPCLENGKIAQVNMLLDDEVAFGSTEFIVFRAKKEITIPDYVYFLSKWDYVREKAIKSMTGTSGRQRVQKDIFDEITLDIPNLNIQKRISALLNSFDEKIEVNNKIISNLEEQAQAIFKSWFVDFEPFQDGNFVESELGMIPEDCEVKPIGKLFDFDIGGGWGKEDPKDKYNLPAYVIRGTDIPESKKGNYNKNNLRFHTKSNLEKRRLKPGDIIFESSGGSSNQDLGRMLYVSQEFLDVYDHDVICASFCKMIRIDDPVDRWFLYNLLEYSYKKRYLTKYEVKSTGISNFSFSIFKDDFKLVFPNNKILENYYKITAKNIELIAKLELQNKNLAEIRDALLPKLMSGEIDVSNIKIKGEEVKNE